MTVQYNPNYAPVAADFFVLASVSSSASFVGGARGIYFTTSASITLVNPGGTAVDFDDVPKGTTLWLNFLYCSNTNSHALLVGLR